ELGQLLPLVVPDSQHAVETPGHNRFAVGAGSNGIHIFASATEIALIVAVGGIDQPHFCIATAGDDNVVRYEADARYLFRELVLHGTELIAISGIPHFEHHIRAAGDEYTTVRPPRDA